MLVLQLRVRRDVHDEGDDYDIFNPCCNDNYSRAIMRFGILLQRSKEILQNNNLRFR